MMVAASAHSAPRCEWKKILLPYLASWDSRASCKNAGSLVSLPLLAGALRSGALTFARAARSSPVALERGLPDPWASFPCFESCGITVHGNMYMCKAS